jgi:hypothetical protein
MEDIQNLIRGLRDFRTRSACISQLAERGEESVEPLLKELNSPNETAAWSAIRVLGMLKAPQAVTPLIEKLKDFRFAAQACEALRLITGQDRPARYERWQDLVAGVSTQEQAVQRPLLETVREAMENSGSTVDQTSHGITVVCPVAKGRSQKIVVVESADSEGAPLVAVYTECGIADSGRYEWALKKNMTTAPGAYAIREMDGRMMFVVVDSLFRQEVTAKHLASIIMSLARRGDLLEKHLSGKDIY